jgi:hypothetical protein
MKNILVQFSLLTLVLFFLSGCTASMHYINGDARLYPASSPENVLIVSQKSIPNKDFVELGYVSINITNADDGDKLKKAVRAEAASIGADAVIDFRIFGLTAGGIAVKYK